MIQAAIIGYGYMGEIRRAEIEKNPSFKLAMICEPDPQRLGDSQPFVVVRDPKAVLESDVKAVFVCTPNRFIPELAIAAMRSGKHVFCEKPPGRTLQDILAMQEEEKKHPELKLMFGFNHRFHPGIQRAKSMIASERLGKVLWLRGVYGKSGGKNYLSSWRNDREMSGGGILLDQGIHMLDLFCYFCGDFDGVKAFTGDSYWNAQVEDNAFLILRNPAGQHAMLHSSATQWKHRFQIEIGLEKGYLIVQGLLSKSGSYGRETLIIGRRQFEDETDAVGNPSEEIIYFDKDLSWEKEVKSFADCIETSSPVVESSSQDALRVMKIIDEAYRQNQNG